MHADHRAEDLLLRRRVGVVGQVEHGGLEVVAAVEPGRTAAADGDLAAVLLGEADEPLAALTLRGADDRTHHRGRDRWGRRR